ncbi:hypothetical protein D3C72_824690 [compost metagenome]
MQIVGGDGAIVIVAQASEQIQPAEFDLILQVVPVLLIAQAIFLRGVETEGTVVDLRVVRVTHIDTRRICRIAIVEVGIELLVVEACQQMVLPVAQLQRFGDLVIHVETLQVFVGGVSKAV